MENIIITGSSNGFGYEASLALARRGYKVWATMRQIQGKNANKKASLEEIAQQESLAIRVLELDVTDAEAIKQVKNQVITEDEKIDVLINNAGIMFIGITEAYSLEQAQDQFNTNFFGIVRTTKAVLPSMREAGKGLIINTSSVAGRVVFPYFGVYCASKHAVEAYSQSLSYELAPCGIEVSIVEPGPFGTGLLYSGPEEADQEVKESYGDQKEVPRFIMENFKQLFQSEHAPDPQTVVQAIVNIVENKRGQRPFRTVVGLDYGTTKVNEALKPIQDSIVKDSLQMGHLLELKS